MTNKKFATEIYTRLNTRYPEPKAALNWQNPWELLVATILSAQCTDIRVNMVTPKLFVKWATMEDLALAKLEEIEEIVCPTGFFHNKAKNIQNCAVKCLALFDGKVPQTMEELLGLPGVARKTANVVLFNAYGIQSGIAVDTHVKRIAYRLGFTKSDKPDIIEQDLMSLFPRKQWGNINHFLVFFGREICFARSPKCDECELNDICPKHKLGQK